MARSNISRACRQRAHEGWANLRLERIGFAGRSTGTLGALRPFYRAGVIVGFVILGSPAIATANFAWPPLIYAYTYRTWWVVLPGLLIEWLVYFFAGRSA